MSLPFIRRLPRTPQEWALFHWTHYQDHKIILGVVSQKENLKLLMPPIWPVPGNKFDAKIAEFHQTLHQQMNLVSGSPSTDMTQVDLSKRDSAESFININYRDHFIFHQFVGIPT